MTGASTAYSFRGADTTVGSSGPGSTASIDERTPSNLTTRAPNGTAPNTPEQNERGDSFGDKLLIGKVLELPIVPPPVEQKTRFQLLQKWEGTIEAVDGEEIAATIRDLTNRSMPDERVVLSLSEIALADASLVEPGSVFYWTIGYRTDAGGTRERVSAIRLRRLPALTARQWKSIAKTAAQTKAIFAADAGE